MISFVNYNIALKGLNTNRIEFPILEDNQNP